MHLCSAFLTSGHSKLFTILPDIHPFTHRRWSQPWKATASSSGAVRVRRLAQEQLDTQIGGDGDQTSNLPFTSKPSLPPEPLQPLVTPVMTERDLSVSECLGVPWLWGGEINSKQRMGFYPD